MHSVKITYCFNKFLFGEAIYCGTDTKSRSLKQQLEHAVNVKHCRRTFWVSEQWFILKKLISEGVLGVLTWQSCLSDSGYNYYIISSHWLGTSVQLSRWEGESLIKSYQWYNIYTTSICFPYLYGICGNKHYVLYSSTYQFYHIYDEVISESL